MDDAEIWPPSLYAKLCDIFVGAIGYCVIPSIVIIDFSFLLSIINLCALPSPTDVNVIAVPAVANALVVAISKVSSVFLIAKTDEGNVPLTVLLYIIGVAPTPANVESGL